MRKGSRSAPNPCARLERIPQVIEKIGGASRDRTDDLIVANDALSQLSYSPMQDWMGFPDYFISDLTLVHDFAADRGEFFFASLAEFLCRLRDTQL
jgi:hypothetical protein